MLRTLCLVLCSVLADDDAQPDAPALFAMHCASCHGSNGDGNGSAQLDRRARSFKDGGFSFGNTELAIGRVIANGVPGSPMPGFAGALDARQREALARHVRSLGPPIDETSADRTEVVVSDRPRVVRGMLPPLLDGGAVIPRGIAIGSADGISAFWRIDADATCALVAVNAGRFVRRSDWNGRGGSTLELVGRRVWTALDGDAELSGTEILARGEFLGTWRRGERAGVRYRARLNERAVVVEESVAAFSTPFASGFSVLVSIEAADSDIALPFGAREECGERSLCVRRAFRDEAGRTSCETRFAFLHSGSELPSREELLASARRGW